MPHTRFEQEIALLRRRSRWRRFRAGLRDTWVLLREFREALIFFALIWLLGSLSFRSLWNASQPEPMTFAESLYDVLTIIFFQPAPDFPEQWYLEVYFFVLPVLGLIALARGMADFVALLFNRQLRQSQWEEAVASTFSNHIIVCGLGHVGVRVVRELIVLDEGIVVIESNADSPRFDELRSYDIPILVGDGRSADVLQKAGLDHAKAFIICTNNDLMNLQIASRIRETNRNIRLVMRMFDDQFARSLADKFNISAVMSASGLAAPAFAGAATGAEIIQTFNVEDNTLVMGRIEVQPRSKLDGATTRLIESELDLSIILHHTNAGIDLHPSPDTSFKAGDLIAVIATLPQLKLLSSRWNRPESA